MINSEILFLIIVVIIVFFTRYLPRILYPFSISLRDDIWHLFIVANIIRTNNHKIPPKIENYLLEDEHDYPPILPWLFSFFNKLRIRKIEKFIPALIDTVAAILFWFVLKYILVQLGLFNLNILLLSTVYFVTYPLYFHIGKGPRTFITSPRILSELFVNCYAIALMFYIYSSDYIWLFFVIFFGVSQALTNRFGLQVILIFSIIISIYYNSLLILMLPIAIISFLYIFFGRMWGRLFSGFIGHGIFMRKYWYNPNNNIKLIQIGFIKESKNLSALIFSLYQRRKGLIAFILSPGIWLGILGILYMYLEGSQYYGNSLLIFSFLWVFSSFFASLLFSVPDLIFWGTGDRYLYYSVPFQVILLIYVFSTVGPWLYYPFLLINLLPIIGNFIHQRRVNMGNINSIKHEKQLFEWVKELNEKPRLLTIFGGKPNKLIYYTDCQVLDVEYSYRPWIYNSEKVKFLFAAYGYPNPQTLHEQLNIYNLDAIVCYKKALETAKQNKIYYDFTKFNLAFENELFIAFTL